MRCTHAVVAVGLVARCGEAHGLERDCDDDAAWKYSDAEDGRGEVEGKINDRDQDDEWNNEDMTDWYGSQEQARVQDKER